MLKIKSAMEIFSRANDLDSSPVLIMQYRVDSSLGLAFSQPQTYF